MSHPFPTPPSDDDLDALSNAQLEVLIKKGDYLDLLVKAVERRVLKDPESWQITCFPAPPGGEKQINLRRLTKVKEMKPERYAQAVQYLQERTRNRSTSLWQIQERLLGYIFTLNGGGTAATLTYMATKPPSKCVLFAWSGFALGTLLMLIYGILMFQAAKRAHENINTDMRKFFTNNRAFENLMENEEREGYYIKFGYWVAGGAAVVFFVSLIVGSCGVILQSF